MQRDSGMLIVISHVHLYFVKRTMSESTAISVVASPKFAVAKNFFEGKMFDFRRITLLCLEKRLPKQKMTIFSKNFWGAMAPFATPGYAYDSNASTSLNNPLLVRV